ncbi:Uncharacterized protein PECH_002121 [Penicillium ucsense]|uniref:Spindle pole body component n=1 Tax=Penicillium ucsense TaxID=2839758 RepID=A0A8J8W2L7_9EURO|nr:Uncharacterized protein PECM_007191 [Penicillium ucsense]KAF7738076.1 Uncharacterized protein PECH_002121 [Penicillium ucsense]
MCRFELLGQTISWGAIAKMLHEILLSLSGQPSPLFSQDRGSDTLAEDDLPLLAPPERALLGSIAHLSRLHAQLRESCYRVSSSHRSVVCRSVSTAISNNHLDDFQKKILEVEKAILTEDSGYVGGYGIVPLSTIVGEFAPWTRRLEWLWDIVTFMQPQHEQANSLHGCTGAALIDHLRAECRTGYLDIKEMAVQLTTAAEMAWMRQLSTWLLCGDMPVFGKGDFLIGENIDPGDGEVEFSLHMELVPKFVTAQTAGSIMFIGKSLNRVRDKTKSKKPDSTTPVTLHREHIDKLAGLKSPISSTLLSAAVDFIRLSLSQSTLSKLLPLPRILEMLTLLHDFLLLGRGEFAVALVSQADSRIEEIRRRGALARVLSGNLAGLPIKEGDVTSVLSQAWAELFSLQKVEDPTDEGLELARELLCLSVNDKTPRPMTPSRSSAAIHEISGVSFEDVLFPVPTSLTAQVQAPLDLFLSSSDIAVYSKINAYLLGIRRAQFRLGNLWKETCLRRIHPSPWGPPRSSSAFGQNKLREGRARDNARVRLMRSTWATASACLFVLSELGGFFQGEVIQESWQHLRRWIEETDSSASRASGSRPSTASTSKDQQQSRAASPNFVGNRPTSAGRAPSMGRHDPEALTVAHRRHLSTLVRSLFLNDRAFTGVLRSLISSVDRFVALVIRLETVQRNMDLETDEGVVESLVDYAQEEHEVWLDLRSTCDDVNAGMNDLVVSLRNIDDHRSGENFGPAWAGSRVDEGSSPGFRHYVPRQPAGVDRLLMKLDFGSLRGSTTGADVDRLDFD